MDELIAETIADARWFPFRFDTRRDEIHFAWVPADVHQAVTFLSDLRPSADTLRVLPRAAVADASVDEAPLHFILHSGLGGSTLLARALGQPGVVTTLKEPPILTDLIAFGLNAPQQQANALREQVTRLLARPFSPGEAVVIKMSSVGNGLVAPMAANRPTSRVLCLHAPLEAMLASLARRGLEGRIGARKLFVGLRNSGFAELGFSEKQLFEQTDLQLAALAWISIQRLIHDCAARFGAGRVRSVESDELVGNPRASLAAIARHFGLALDVERQLASGLFERHAKTGEPFDAGARERAAADALRVHGAEIQPIVEWARKVAEANRIAWDLPYPLFPKAA
jgi:hypothetical protein